MPRPARQRRLLRSAAAAITAAPATVEAAEAASVAEPASTAATVVATASTEGAAFAAREVAAAPPLGVAHERHAEPGVLTPPPRHAPDADGLRQFGRDR